MRLPVTLKLRPSPALGGALVAAHGAAALGIVASDLPTGEALPVLIFLLVSLAFSLWRHVFRIPVSALILMADGTLDCEFRDGSSAPTGIQPQTTVFPWLVALVLRTEGKSLALALPPDALERDAHRQLRLWLRWRANAASA